jgi:hypothetical protein
VDRYVFLLGLLGALAIAFVRQRARWERWRMSLAFSSLEARRLVDRFVARSRWLRFGPIALLLVIPSAWVAVTNRPPPFYGWPSQVTLAGVYVVAVFASVWALPRPQRGAARSASLVPRLVSDHVHPRLARWLRALPIAALAMVPLYVLMPVRESKHMTDAAFSAVALATVAVPAIAYALIRSILRYPLPAALEEVATADKAIRATAARAIAAGGVAALSFIVATLAWQFAYTSDVDLIRLVGGAASLAALVGGIVAWINFGSPTAPDGKATP